MKDETTSSKKRNDTEKVMQILNSVTNEDNFPTEEELGFFPFSEQLIDLAYSEEYRDHNDHVKKVVVEANRIILNTPSSIVTPEPDQNLIRELNALFNLLHVWASNKGIDRNFLIQMGAIYHDIGKWIVKERHPVEGFYLLQYLYHEERESLIQLLEGDRLDGKKDEKAYNMLLNIIRDHDKFGIISTGEGSLAVLIDLLNPAKKDVEFYKVAFVSLLMINLADISVSAPNGLHPIQAKWLVEDVNLILESLEEVDGSRISLLRKLIEADQDEERTIIRLSRFVNACYQNAIMVQIKKNKNWKKENSGVEPNPDYEYKEEDWPEIDFEIILDKVNEMMQFGFLAPERNKFCRNFAHFCKLDYALYFFGEVARQYNIVRLKDKNNRYPLKFFIEAILEVLKNIVNAYQDMIIKDDLSPRRIGVQMQALLRTPKIKETVSSLLTRNVSKQMQTMSEISSWITNEISVWLFV